MEELLALIKVAPVAGVIFIFTIITSLYAFYDQGVYDKFMLNPYRVSRGERVYTIFTSGIIHADWMHLIFNMLSFYYFAFMLETMIGDWQFGVLYIASLALSDLPSILKHKDNPGYNSLGASGAISAVIFSFILYYPLAEMRIFFAIPMYAVVFGVLYLAYSAYASRQSGSIINHDAHFYGAISGIIITIIFNPPIVISFIGQIQAALPGGQP